MKFLLDTCIFLWFISGDNRLSNSFREKICDPGNEVFLSTVSIWESIFNPYFTTKDTYFEKGLGLGLPICYSIIKRHRGYISIQSHKGKGTSVEFYIPVFKS